MNLQLSLSHLIRVFRECSSLPPEIAEEAADLRDRLETGQFHLAVLGQFKRGKSTLINALLGAEILPSGVLPVTLVPVFLRYGTQPDVEIHYQNGHGLEHSPLSQLGEYVNEANNPKNVKQVSRVELRYPASLLKNGIIVIDTPGVGSTYQHNTDTTIDLLPRCDAALVILSADPPITAAEVSFLQRLQPHVVRLFFVLNKIDYLDAQDAIEAECFLHKTVSTSLGIESPTIFPLSAREGLRARLNKEEDNWQQSGMADLEQALLDFAADGKQSALSEAVQQKTINLIAKADQLLALQQRAMELPLETLEQKLAEFRQYASTASQHRQEMLDRLRGDETRLVQELEKSIAVLRETAHKVLLQLSEEAGLPTYDDSQVDSFHQAVREYFDHERTALGSHYREVLNDILVERARRAQEIRENLRQEAASLLEFPHFPLLVEDVMVELEESAWMIEHLMIPVRPKWADRWLSESKREQRHARQREKLAHELVIQNAEKVRWWVLRTIQQSTHAFGQRITLEVDKTIQQIDQALRAGYAQRSEQQEIQHEILAMLAANRQHLREIWQEIETPETNKERTSEKTSLGH